ncbi:MAG: CZB domain-containing protein [Bacteroidales bacterium]|nr:CZB domain-containing protein [Bacteroidales bacterium]
MIKYNKSEIINKLICAKTAHERWMTYAEAIYNGINFGEEHTPLLHTECEFGKWCADNGQLLYFVEAPKTLLEDHKSLHRVYMEIYKLMHDNSSSNFFNKARVEKKKKESLEKNFKVLNSISGNMIKAIDSIIDKINSMSKDEIMALG